MAIGSDAKAVDYERGYFRRGDQGMPGRTLLGLLHAAFLGVLSFVFFYSTSGYMSSLVTHHQKYSYSEKTTRTPKNEEIKSIATETVAYYTEMLAWFTGVLAIVSIVQGIFLYKADKTTAKAANAALLSAEASQLQARAAVAAEI
jgi:hypothetical protein